MMDYFTIWCCIGGLVCIPFIGEDFVLYVLNEYRAQSKHPLPTPILIAAFFLATVITIIIWPVILFMALCDRDLDDDFV